MTHWRTTAIGICGLLGGLGTGIPLLLKGNYLEGIAAISAGLAAIGIGYHAADKKNSITVGDK